MAFGECHNLETFELNEGIQELGWLCLWGTGITELRIPQQVQKTREQLGLVQDPKVLRLPDGLEIVGDSWFASSGIEKLIIPKTVRELGNSAFAGCAKLREVVFEPDSRLETVRKFCFSYCGIEQIVIPKSVRDIGDDAFNECESLRSLAFEEGSQLEHVGFDALEYTPLEEETGLFPATAQIDARL